LTTGQTLFNWRKWLVIYAFALASLVILVVGGLLVSADRSLSRAQIFSAVGLNLIASVVFSIFFVALSGRVQDRAIRENVDQGFDQLRADLIAQLAHHDEFFLPTAAYPATGSGDFGTAYNVDVANSLRQSGTVTFYGRTGWYMAARLGMMSTRQLNVRMALLDPASTAFDRHVRDEMTQQWARQMSFEQLRAELERGFYQTLTALFECRHDHTITILLHRDVSTYRYLLTEDVLFISWLRTERSAGRHMPESHRFGSRSLLHVTLGQEIDRRFSIADDLITFRDTDPEEKLISILEDLRHSLGGRTAMPARPPITAGDISRWRADYAEQCAEFIARLTEIAKLDKADRQAEPTA
jgi:hypothetical protein